MQGLEINEETLALDVIHEHALSGDFLGAEHTLRHVREDWQPRLIDRHNYEQWMAGGGTSMRERARAKIDEILGAEPRHILPPDIEKRIRTITERVIAASGGISLKD
jgi:trimethylamine--corrinoid protein Co-methyltransferase